MSVSVPCAHASVNLHHRDYEPQVDDENASEAPSTCQLFCLVVLVAASRASNRRARVQFVRCDRAESLVAQTPTEAASRQTQPNPHHVCSPAQRSAARTWSHVRTPLLSPSPTQHHHSRAPHRWQQRSRRRREPSRRRRRGPADPADTGMYWWYCWVFDDITNAQRTRPHLHDNNVARCLIVVDAMHLNRSAAVQNDDAE